MPSYRVYDNGQLTAEYTTHVGGRITATYYIKITSHDEIARARGDIQDNPNTTVYLWRMDSTTNENVIWRQVPKTEGALTQDEYDIAMDEIDRQTREQKASTPESYTPPTTQYNTFQEMGIPTYNTQGVLIAQPAEVSRDVNNQSGLIGLIDSNQSAHSIKPISRFFCINQANLKIFVDLLLS